MSISQKQTIMNIIEKLQNFKMAAKPLFLIQNFIPLLHSSNTKCYSNRQYSKLHCSFLLLPSMGLTICSFSDILQREPVVLERLLPLPVDMKLSGVGQGVCVLLSSLPLQVIQEQRDCNFQLSFDMLGKFLLVPFMCIMNGQTDGQESNKMFLVWR